MSKPTTDRGAITQILTRLSESGWTPRMLITNDDEAVPATTVHEATKAVMEVEEAFVVVEDATKGHRGWLYFVLGNEDPDEVLCNYTVNLEPALEWMKTEWWGF